MDKLFEKFVNKFCIEFKEKYLLSTKISFESFGDISEDISEEKDDISPDGIFA